MPQTRAARCYSIEIKDAEGSVVVLAVASWADKDRRIAPLLVAASFLVG